MLQLLSDNWFSLIQSLGIIASILFAARSLRQQTEQLAVTNTFLVTQHHRELWGYFLNNEKLGRVFDPDADLISQPITEIERMFVNMMFLHTAACMNAVKKKAIPRPHGLETDLREILALPVPREVWKTVQFFYDREFNKFVRDL